VHNGRDTGEIGIVVGVANINVVVKCVKDLSDVSGSVHHSIIHKENPARCNSVKKIISYLNEAQHVSGDTPPIIKSLKLH
jgi:hypothetical protein